MERAPELLTSEREREKERIGGIDFQSIINRPFPVSPLDSHSLSSSLLHADTIKLF
jgi:hypothetical protein